MNFFKWFDRKVDLEVERLPPIETDGSIVWHDKKKIQLLKIYIKNLEKNTKTFSESKEAVSRIQELETVYKHLLNFYNKHNPAELQEVAKKFPTFDPIAVNRKEQELEKFLTELIPQLKKMHESLAGFSAYDPSFDEYTEISSNNLQHPNAVDFALSNGGVLQSAREAVDYRLKKGKKDFDFYYHTRTIAIYFKENNQLFVAFDDDPFDNILLQRSQEGLKAHNSGEWIVDANESLIANAINRAKKSGRIARVTTEQTRSDSLQVAKCIIGNKTNVYDEFIKKHLSRKLICHTLKDSSLNQVNERKILIRLVMVGAYFDYDLNAVNRCIGIRRARGVQKISTGNGGSKIPYIGLIIYQKLRLIQNLQDSTATNKLITFFNSKENKLPRNANSLFYSSLASLIDFINTEQDLELVSEICIELVKKLVKHKSESIEHLFSAGIPLLKPLIKKPDQIHEVVEKFIEFIECCEGTEDQTSKALSRLQSLIKTYELSIFDDFLIPIAKSQTVATFMILESTKEIYDRRDIQSKKDLELIKYISKTYLTKANTILKDIIIAGSQIGVLPQPISVDAEIIKVFLANAPAYILDLYLPFKEIYTKSDLNSRDEKILLLFKDVKQMKQEIFDGKLSKSYDEKMLMSVLYFVFACHDMTVPKENYETTWSSRQDRSNDIPAKLARPITIQLTRGSFILKDNEREVDSESWKLLIEAAEKIKERKTFDIAGFGFQMLDQLIKNTLKVNKQFFIFGIYQHSLNNGESLPEFRLEHQTLMKYKEFIGDRVANDLVFSILQESMKKNADFFYEQQMIALGRKKVDFRGLAKQISSIMNSVQSDEKKKEIILRILVQNGFSVDNTDAVKNKNIDELNNWLISMKPNVIEKGLLAKVFLELYGEEYTKMQEEMSKYEFKKEARTGTGKKYTLLLSKKKTHSLAMYNMGVCVASDDKLWNDTNFWQLIIFDENNNAHGGTILRFIEDNNKKYLTLSINPASSILSQTSPEQIFDKIIQASRIVAQKTRCSNILIPIQSSIHSNRGSIQAIINSRFKEKDKIKLSQSYQFSYAPYNYSYEEFYKL